MRIGEKIKQAREVRGLSQEALARAIGISQPAIKKIESGETGRSRFMSDILKFLDIEQMSPLFAVSTPSPPPGLPYVDISAPDRQSMPLDVPVMGTAVGGSGGKFVYEGGIVDYARRPPGIARAKDVFCLNVQGESMAPRYQEGELIFLNPHLPPRIGDDVVIEFHPNEQNEHVQGCLKRLVRRTASKIIVEQFNPAEELEFDIAGIKAIHRVLTMRELMGV